MKDKEIYDVIVIGAGPSGCTAARTLAKSGLKVLLLEKYKLPRYKSCSGILIEKSIRLAEKYFESSIPSYVTCAPTQNCGMVFVDDSGREYGFESKGLNIWRDKFDYWLTGLAEKSGAKVQDGSAVTEIQEENDYVRVTANDIERRAKAVIDCSGAVGIGKKTGRNIITFQTYNHGAIDLDTHYFYAYLQPELSGYDAWFNVKDGALILGVSTPKTQNINKYYCNFVAYMEEKHGLRIDEQIKTDKWIIRDIRPPFEIDYGNSRVLKAGENAGFLNPMGEGISAAIESGYCAAQSIILSHDTPKAIEYYKKIVAPTEDYMKRQWQLVGRISKKFSYMLD